MVLIGRKGTDRFHFVQAVANFCVDELRIRNTRFKFAVLPLTRKNKVATGVAVDEKDIVAVFIKPNLPPMEMARTICHEFIHVAQICRGHLKTVMVGKVDKLRWRGKIYPNKTPYLDRPWEILALQGQDILARKFEDWSCTSAGKRYIMNLR